MGLGGGDIKRKLTNAAKVAKRLLSAYTREGEIDYTKPHKKFTDAQKNILDTSDCPDYAVENLSPTTLKRIKSTGDNFITGSELVDATSSTLRKIYESNNDLEAQVGKSKSFLGVVKKISNSMVRGDMVTSYPYRLQQKILEFGQMTKEINNLVEAQSNGTALSFDDEDFAAIVRELRSSFEVYKDAIDASSRLGLTQGNKNIKEEAKFAAQIEYSLTKRMNSLRQGVDSLKKSTSVSRAFQRESERYSRTANYDGRSFLKSVESLTGSIRRRDYANFAKKILSMMKFRKSSKKKNAAKENAASKEFSKAMGGMSWSRSMTGLTVLTIALQVAKQVLGHMFGINDIAADFNQKLVEAHGLSSLNLSGNVKYDAQTNFGDLRQKFFAFGAETKSFITPEDALSITKEYEKVGIKLKELLNNTEETNSMMYLTLNYSMNLGLSLDELASYQADWKRNLGMDAKQMGAVLQLINKNYAESGLNAHIYLDAIQNAGYDFGIWNNSITSLLEVQHTILQRKDMNVDASKKTVDALNQHINNMTATQWDILASKLPGDRIADFLDRDKARLEKNLAESKDPLERSKSAYAIQRITKARINPDPAYSRLLFREIGSLESKYELVQQSLRSVFGDEIKGELDKGLYSQSLNYRMKALLGFSGTSDDWEAMKYGLSTILDPKMDFSALAKKADDASKKVDVKPLEGLGQAQTAAYAQQATYKEIFESMIKQYVNKYIAICENIANYLLKFIQFKSNGKTVDPRLREEAFEKLKEILEKISKEKDLKKRLALIQQLYDPSILYMQNGGDGDAVKKFARELKLGKETMTALDQWLIPPQPTSMPGMSTGTSTSLSSGWVAYINKANPSKATEIINAINTNSVRTGVPADFMAGKIMQESGFNPTLTSHAGAMGIAQFMPETAASVGLTRHEAYNDITKAISKSFDYDVTNRKIIANQIKGWSPLDQQMAVWTSYNAGAGRFQQAFKAAKSALGREPSKFEEMVGYLPHREHREYAKKIKAHLDKYGAGGGGGGTMTTPAIPLPAPPPKADTPNTKLAKKMEKEHPRTPPPRKNKPQRRRINHARASLQTAHQAVRRAHRTTGRGRKLLRVKRRR